MGLPEADGPVCCNWNHNQPVHPELLNTCQSGTSVKEKDRTNVNQAIFCNTEIHKTCQSASFVKQNYRTKHVNQRVLSNKITEHMSIRDLCNTQYRRHVYEWLIIQHRFTE